MAGARQSPPFRRRAPHLGADCGSLDRLPWFSRPARMCHPLKSPSVFPRGSGGLPLSTRVPLISLPTAGSPNQPLVRRLIAFGKFALSNRRDRGLGGKPETFNFLGLAHLCGRSRSGRFLLRRQTERKRMTTKLHELSRDMQRRRHQSIPEQGRWLNAVVRGHAAYYGVPTNGHSVAAFRTQVARHWHRALLRRGQRRRLPWARMRRLVARWLPPTPISHPWPEQRFDARTRGKSPVR